MSMPAKLHHVSTLAPNEFKNHAIMSFENETITGERVNAIWADDISDDANAYLARGNGGMICAGPYVFYSDNNLQPTDDGRLLLKYPVYKYEFSSDGFEKIENNGVTEYIKRDGQINIDDTVCTKITDVTGLCNTHQIFTVNSDEPIGTKALDIGRQNGFDAAVAYVNEKIADGSLLYRNAEIGRNVDKIFAQGIKQRNYVAMAEDMMGYEVSDEDEPLYLN